MDDLKYLFRRQLEERVRAEGAGCAEAREAHQALAGFYEQRIHDLTHKGMAILDRDHP